MFKILFKKLQKHGFPYQFLFKTTGKLFASTCKPHIVVDTLWTMKVSSGHFLYVDIQSLTVQAVMQHSPLSPERNLYNLLPAPADVITPDTKHIRNYWWVSRPSSISRIWNPFVLNLSLVRVKKLLIFSTLLVLISSEKFVALAVYLGQLTCGDAMRGVHIYLHSVV